ncbi:MAG: hypothetical protein R3257_00270 [bacterium]|nr:hypothetical protein [bacterium]
MTPSSPWSEEEALLWSVFKNFETLAVQQYRQFIPEFLTSEKKNFVTKLLNCINGTIRLENSPLAKPVKHLTQSAKGQNEITTLVAQGMLLEPLGFFLYGALATNPNVSQLSRELAGEGKNICQQITQLAPEKLSTHFPDGEALFEHFINASEEVLSGIDILGEALDEIYSQKYQIHYSDIIAEFGAELIQTCVDMGMERRKLMCHLTACLMGL